MVKGGGCTNFDQLVVVIICVGKSEKTKKKIQLC